MAVVWLLWVLKVVFKVSMWVKCANEYLKGINKMRFGCVKFGAVVFLTFVSSVLQVIFIFNSQNLTFGMNISYSP